jgi:hypothetical protein
MIAYDPRAAAFEALLPLAAALDRAVRRAQREVTQFYAHNRDQWAMWNTSQLAAALGQARFFWVTSFCKVELTGLPGVSYFSTPAQEKQNLFLWSVEPRLGLRVKHDPAELSAQGDDTLFDMAPLERDQTACLTWTSGPLPTIDAVRLQAGHGSHWSIPLAELLGALEGDGRVTRLVQPPFVKSRKEGRPSTDREEQSQ